MDTKLCLLLENFFHLLYLVTLLEVSFLNLLDPALILLLERVEFVHAHVHDVLFGSWVCDHHAKVGW